MGFLQGVKVRPDLQGVNVWRHLQGVNLVPDLPYLPIADWYMVRALTVASGCQ
jgi:hypothetical protein